MLLTQHSAAAPGASCALPTPHKSCVGDGNALWHLQVGGGPHHLQQRPVRLCAVQRRIRHRLQPHAPEEEPRRPGAHQVRGRGGGGEGALRSRATGVSWVVATVPSKAAQAQDTEPVCA